MPSKIFVLYITVLAFLLPYLLEGKIQSDIPQCEELIRDSRPPKKIQEENPYKLWPGFVSPDSERSGQTLIGTDFAMSNIWANQNPSDCENAKYLIVEGWFQGFGSEVHVYGVSLAAALATNRVLLQTGGWTWRYKNEHCRSQGKESLECYFEPISKCTLEDAFSRAGMKATMGNNQLLVSTSTNKPSAAWTDAEDKKLLQAVLKYGRTGKWNEIATTVPKHTAVECLRRWETNGYQRLRSKQNKSNQKPMPENVRLALDSDDSITDVVMANGRVLPIPRVLDAKVASDNNSLVFMGRKQAMVTGDVLYISGDAVLKLQKFVPSQFHHVASCAGLQPSFYFFWWRAISATYLLRPNAATLKLLEKYSDPEIKRAEGKCVSMYVRHGDKVLREMQTVHFSTYAKTARKLWHQKHQQGINTTKLLYVSSEDINVFRDAKNWAQRVSVNVRYSNLSQIILSDQKPYVRQHELENTLPANHVMEYFSYLLHLQEVLRCDLIVCTMPSNYCRLLDELRMTVGGRANALNADVSTETCQSVPCIRDFGLANYKGQVYDPKTRLW